MSMATTIQLVPGSVPTENALTARNVTVVEFVVGVLLEGAVEVDHGVIVAVRSNTRHVERLAHLPQEDAIGGVKLATSVDAAATLATCHAF
jgi:hypothetical protein